MKATFLFIFTLTLVACGAESPTAPTADASTPTDCPRTGNGSVIVDGGVCVYTCPGGAVACPGVGCVDLGGNPDHCGACGNRCPLPNRCELRVGVTPDTWFCRAYP